MNAVDWLLAKAQVRLATITLLGFLAMLGALLWLLNFSAAKPSPDLIALVSTATGVLGTIATQQSGYFFARHRPQSDGDDVNPTGPAAPATTK
ncbi:MAG: hypothetical protein KGL39_41705 [Patescibacteria group bacterium]|nr:hypothetical protein [Patescibacteria group bacterium]